MIDIEKILSQLALIKSKNQFSKSKNSFLHFCEFLNLTLDTEHIKQIEELEAKTHKKHRQLKAVDFNDIDNTIKRLRNKKLKVSYQTILATGLRVSELAQITKDDCLVREDGLLSEIHLFFIAKGGIPSTVKIAKEEYPLLYGHLKALIETQSHKIFYSTAYLQSKAKEYGFTCHDLRRA